MGSDFDKENNFNGYNRGPSIHVEEMNEAVVSEGSDVESEEDQKMMESSIASKSRYQNGITTATNDNDLKDSFKQPPDLKYLSSTNFSSESLPEPESNSVGPPPPLALNYSTFLNMNGSPITPTYNTFSANTPSMPYSPVGLSNGIGGAPLHRRRYSNSSLTNSPITQPSASANSRGSRPRPKSAIFMMDSNHYPISEHGSPIQSPIQNNNPRARNSMHFSGRTNYMPTSNGSISNLPSRNNSPTRSTSPSRSGRQFRSKSPVRRSNSPVKYLPFNFKPQEVMMHNNNSNGSLSVKPAHRKGHKYKHSSVSMNLFQEPPPALVVNNQQAAIPDLYPIPNFTESLGSIKPHQKLKLGFSSCHFFLSVIVFLVGYHFKLPSFSTLAHLVFYDSLGSLIIVFVDIMSNFEVWNNSSIAYPFGLGRLEVLVGFALSASLIMVGCDLVSHFLEEFVINLVVVDADQNEQHLSHHIHGDHDGDETNWIIYQFVLFLVVGVTPITSKYIYSLDRIGEMISSTDNQTPNTNSKIDKLTKGKGGLLDEDDSKKAEHDSLFSKLEGWWYYLSKNPTRLLTLLYAFYLVVSPLLPVSFVSEIGFDIDEVTTLAVALLLCFSGWKLVKSLGSILLLSYPHSDYDYHNLKSSIIDKILTLDCYKQTYNLEKLFITKFNYQLFVIGIKITMKNANVDDESRLRFEVNRLVKSCLEKADYTGKTSNIEITIDTTRI